MNNVRHQRLIQNLSDRKERFRMYKDGRKWVVAGVATLALGIGAVTNLNMTFAATPDDANPSAQQAQTPAPQPQPVPNSTVNQSTPGPKTTALQETSQKLSDAITEAKNDDVNVVTNTTTETVDPDHLTQATADITTKNAQQIQQLQDAKATQDANNADYDEEKAQYDQGAVDINPASQSGWTKDEVTKFLAGDSNLKGSVSPDEVIQASNNVKDAANVTLSGDSQYVKPTNSSLDNGNLPLWRYNNAFVNPADGHKVDVVESITNYTLFPDAAKPSIDGIMSSAFGFTPHNMESVSVKLQYFDAGTDNPVTLNALVGIGDIDGTQAAKFNNKTTSLLKGNELHKDNNLAYMSNNDADESPTDPNYQLWAYQTGVTETDYTFYNYDLAHTNRAPIQQIGGVPFTVSMPKAPVKKIEKASVDSTQLNVTTDNTIHYSGAGSDTPRDVSVPVTWVGTFADGKYSWTPDKTDLITATPIVAGYDAAPTAGWNLGVTSADPANQMVTVNYIKKSAQSVTLDIHYVDNSGNPVTLLRPETLIDVAGKTFVSVAPHINGYTLVNPKQQVVTGDYHGDKMVLTLVYKANPTHNETGNSVPTGTGTPIDTPTDTPTGTPAGITGNTPNEPNAGTVTNTTTPNITDETPQVPLANTFGKSSNRGGSPATGTLGTKRANRKNGVELTTTGFSTSSGGTRKGQQSDSNSLPQTGESSQSWISVFGLAMLSVLSGLLFVNRRQKN